MGYRLGDSYVKLSQNPRSSPYKKLQDLLSRCDYMFSQGLTQENINTIVNKFRKKKFILEVTGTRPTPTALKTCAHVELGRKA